MINDNVFYDKLECIYDKLFLSFGQTVNKERCNILQSQMCP